MRIVFLGTGEIGIPSLRALAAAHEVVAVFTQPDRPAGRDLKLRPSPIKVVAEEIGLPIFQPEKIRAPEALAGLRELKPDLIVVVAYGQILPRAILDLPRLGCLNVHASLLPRHRGASPLHAAILAGDAEAGVTIMWMAEGLDTGDMLIQNAVRVGRHETGGELHDRLAALAPAALLQAVCLIEKGEAPRIRQDEAQTTYAPKLSKDDGRIDWTCDAVEIGRQIRAMTPWPGAFTHLPGGVLLKIHQALLNRKGVGAPGEILRANKRGILVAAGKGAVLLTQVQAAGGKRLFAGEFLRGKPLEKGTHFQSL